MPISRETAAPSRSENTPIYRTSFVRHAHEVVMMGYSLLDTPSFARQEEEVITGELVRSMQTALEDRGAPHWAKYFWAMEETRVNNSTRKGKRRLRIDIEIVKIQQGPRPRFRFEAKRLHDATSRNNYLGENGLGCFLDGRYAKEDETGGMLGFVQADSVNSHAEAIKEAITHDPEAYAVAKDGQWKACEIVKGLTSFETRHRRNGKHPSITLLHTLLLFC